MQVSDIIQLLSICSRTCIFFTAELCVIPALVEIFPVAETIFLAACSFSPGSKSLQIFSLLHEFFAGNQCAAHSYGTLTVILRSFIPVIRSLGRHKIFLCINRYKKMFSLNLYFLLFLKNICRIIDIFIQKTHHIILYIFLWLMDQIPKYPLPSHPLPQSISRRTIQTQAKAL